MMDMDLCHFFLFVYGNGKLKAELTQVNVIKVKLENIFAEHP